MPAATFQLLILSTPNIFVMVMKNCSLWLIHLFFYLFNKFINCFCIHIVNIYRICSLRLCQITIIDSNLFHQWPRDWLNKALWLCRIIYEHLNQCLIPWSSVEILSLSLFLVPFLCLQTTCNLRTVPWLGLPWTSLFDHLYNTLLFGAELGQIKIKQLWKAGDGQGTPS